MRKYGIVTSIEKERTGWFMTDVLYDWVAYCWNERVAQARTKKECIKKARERGYSVPKHVI